MLVMHALTQMVQVQQEVEHGSTVIQLVKHKQNLHLLLQ